jgi:hypothetical protein
VEGPAFRLDRLTELDQCILEIMPKLLQDIEVVVSEGGVRPDLTDYFKKVVQKSKMTQELDVPILKLSKEPFCHATAVKPMKGV